MNGQDTKTGRTGGLSRAACPQLPNTGTNSSVFIVHSSELHAKLLPLLFDKYPNMQKRKKTPPTVAKLLLKVA